MRTAARGRAPAALSAVALAAVLALTLVPTSGPDSGVFHWCLRCGDAGLSDFLSNILLFVPFAAGVRWWSGSARRTVAAALLLSAGIELAQIFIPGRESSLGDIVANTAGAVLVALAWRWWPARRGAPAGLAGAAAALVLLAAAAAALRPSFPRTVYYGQWTPELEGLERYQGVVVSAGVGDVPLPDGRVADSRVVRDRLAAGEAVVVRALAGPPPARLAPVLNVADAAAREILMLGADRDDLVLLVRRRAADWHLGQPEWRWSGALAGVRPGDSLVIAARGTSAGYCLALNGRERCGFRSTVGQAWVLLHAVRRVTPAGQALLECLGLALLGVAAGLCVRRDVVGAATALAVVAGAVALPPLVGLSPTPAVQVAALAAGLAAGALVP